MVDQAFDDVVPEPVLQHFLSHAVRAFVGMAGGGAGTTRTGANMATNVQQQAQSATGTAESQRVAATAPS